jgi:signal transduction histidine kinase
MYLLCALLICGRAQQLFASKGNEVLKKSELDSAFNKLEPTLITNPDSIKKIIKVKIEECLELKYEIGVAKGYYLLGKSNILGAFNYPLAFDYLYKSQRIFERNNLPNESAKCNMQLGLINYLQRNFKEAQDCFSSASKTFYLTGDVMRYRRTSYLYSLSASENGEFANADRGLAIAKKFINVGSDNSAYREYYYGRGVFFARQNMNDSAIANFLTVINKYSQEGDIVGSQLFNGELAQAYFNKGDKKNARFYAERVLDISSKNNIVKGLGVLQSQNLLYKLDMAEKNYKGAAEHLNEYIVLKDSMVNERKSFELASIKSKYEIAKAEQENKLEMAKQTATQEAQIQDQRFLKNFFIVGCVFFVIMILFLVYTNNLKKNKNAELAESLHKLKETQEQLIRQEKLASMGKLSAGIAHEIRNPLNFINNFSELSSELLVEYANAKTPKEKEEIFADIQESMQKINEHGKRADSIVKNMLDHSRSYTPEKETVQMNVVCENNLSMAINGMRVMEPDFNCKVKREYAPDLPPIKIVEADLGRVLLNIFNNAFYAMNEKKKQIGRDYSPLLTISISVIDSNMILKIIDNGTGMPKSVRERIFEPFFTTKAAGQGTGLGLSICNEIVKMHKGELLVDSVEGESTTFSISLPC